ncbi:MAG: hypothetical protein JWO16_406, partial [Sphingomonas bacterium]|nr:hypothetical protein [Sphingomonas bacterium]
GGFGGDGASSGNGGATKAPRYGDTKRGAARFSFFDYPEPVVVADTNFNRGIDTNEFRAAALDSFTELDTNHDGRITRGELPKLIAPVGDGPRGRGGGFGRRPAGAPAGGDEGREE